MNFQNEAKEVIHHRSKKVNTTMREKKRKFRDVKMEFPK